MPRREAVDLAALMEVLLRENAGKLVVELSLTTRSRWLNSNASLRVFTPSARHATIAAKAPRPGAFQFFAVCNVVSKAAAGPG